MTLIVFNENVKKKKMSLRAPKGSGELLYHEYTHTSVLQKAAITRLQKKLRTSAQFLLSIHILD